MIEVVDAIRELLEPDPSDVAKDDTAAEPFKWQPNTLYVFPAGPDEHRVVEAGSPPREQERFLVRAVLVADPAGEEAGQRRSRTVSLHLDTKAHTYARIVAANAYPPSVGDADPLWQELRSTIDYDFVRTLQIRGVSLRISGSRYLTS